MQQLEEVVKLQVGPCVHQGLGPEPACSAGLNPHFPFLRVAHAGFRAVPRLSTTFLCVVISMPTSFPQLGAFLPSRFLLYMSPRLGGAPVASSAPPHSVLGFLPPVVIRVHLCFLCLSWLHCGSRREGPRPVLVAIDDTQHNPATWEGLQCLTLSE